MLWGIVRGAGAERDQSRSESFGSCLSSSQCAARSSNRREGARGRMALHVAARLRSRTQRASLDYGVIQKHVLFQVVGDDDVYDVKSKGISLRYQVSKAS